MIELECMLKQVNVQWTLHPFPTLKGPHMEHHLVTPQYGLNDPPLEKN